MYNGETILDESGISFWVGLTIQSATIDYRDLQPHARPFHFHVALSIALLISPRSARITHDFDGDKEALHTVERFIRTRLAEEECTAQNVLTRKDLQRLHSEGGQKKKLHCAEGETIYEQTRVLTGQQRHRKKGMEGSRPLTGGHDVEEEKIDQGHVGRDKAGITKTQRSPCERCYTS